jgi:hypothetical protein
MASHTLPGLGLSGGYSAGDDGWTAEMNLNLLLLSALSTGVKSRVTALPGSPANGDIYIVPSPDNRVAIRDGGAWTYLTPPSGLRLWVTDESALVAWNGTAWVSPKQPFDIATFVAGAPANSETVLRYVFARAVTFADEFAGSQATAGTAATASTTFTVKKNGSSVGMIVFGAAGASGAFTTTGTSVSFAAGDYLEIVAPSTADTTLANISITLAGVR